MRMAMLMSFTSVIRVGRSLMRMAILMSFTSEIRVGRSYNDKVLCTAIVPFQVSEVYLSARAQDKWAGSFLRVIFSHI